MCVHSLCTSAHKRAPTRTQTHSHTCPRHHVRDRCAFLIGFRSKVDHSQNYKLKMSGVWRVYNTIGVHMSNTNLRPTQNLTLDPRHSWLFACWCHNARVCCATRVHHLFVVKIPEHYLTEATHSITDNDEEMKTTAVALLLLLSISCCAATRKADGAIPADWSKRYDNCEKKATRDTRKEESE